MIQQKTRFKGFIILLLPARSKLEGESEIPSFGSYLKSNLRLAALS